MTEPPIQNLESPHPAPLSGWRRLAADWVAVGGATLVCQALAVVTSLALRGALSPSQMGVWQGLKLLLGYANYANLGVSKGAARELAIAAGSGQTRQAEEGLNLAFTVNTITSIAYGGCLAAVGLWLDRDRGGDNPWFLGLIALAVLVVLQRHLTFHVTILRCRQQFALTAWTSLVEGALTLVAACLGAWQWGLPGLYGGTFLTMAGALAFLRWRGVKPFHFGWQWAEIKRLVGIGGPILLGGVALSLFQSLDKLMLLSFSPDREFELGCYSTTLLITAQIYGLANMFAMVAAPRYAELFGRTGSRQAAAGLAARASEPLAAVTSAAAVLGLLVAAPLLARWFPAYRPGLPPALWLVPGVAFLSLTLPLNQYLVAVGRERISLVASIAALAAAAIADYAVLSFGYGMLGVAAATAIVYAGYHGLMLRLSVWPVIDARLRRRYLWSQITLLAPLALAVCLTDVRAERLTATRLPGTLLIVLSAWCLAVLVVWRRGAWMSAWRAEAIDRGGDRVNLKSGGGLGLGRRIVAAFLGQAFCRERPPWRSVTHQGSVKPAARNATEGVPYRRLQAVRALLPLAVSTLHGGWWLGRRLAEAVSAIARSLFWPAMSGWRAKRSIAAVKHDGPKTHAARPYPSHYQRLSMAELERRCQKPNHRQVGNWMARRIARPLALRITWYIAPKDVSAHAVTCAATFTALLAAACFMTGLPALSLAGAILFQIWYLLDHVDGQIARLRGTSSLDGTQLDYLMHHVVNLTIPCSLGYGLWKSTGAEIWLLLGFAHAAGLLLLSLANDTRSKAIVDRLEDLASRPAERLSAGLVRGQRLPRNTYRGALRRGVHLARKLCEIHVVMNVVTVLAAAQYMAAAPWLMRWYVGVMAPLAVVTAVATLARDVRRGATESEFGRWWAADGDDRANPDHHGHQAAEPEVAPTGELVVERDA